MTTEPSLAPQPSVTGATAIAPSGDALLARACTQWGFGDWSALASMQHQVLHNHPDRGLLALLSGAAQMQLGHVALARSLVQQALANGCNSATAARVLVSGVYNTLGRSAAINGNQSQAAAHFTRSIELSPFQSDTRLMAQARVREQTEQVAQSLSAAQPEPSNTLPQPQSALKVEKLATFDLGQAWSSNTVIFRQHGILTWDGFQYTAFYVNETTLRVVQRTLTNDYISSYDLDGQYNLRDAHNSISLGMDRSGYLHISYDHHATKLRYRRSSQPNSIDGWTDELPMTGANEDRVTYPTFILPRAGYPLTLLFRDGVHNKGSARLKTYDETTARWTDRPTPILSGADQKPWTSNAYWNHPAIGSDGSLHLSFVWRTDTIGEQQLVNNVNIGYAWSPDNGFSWFTSRGQPCKLPMTQVNAETVRPVSLGCNLINQTSMALDSLNRPHIVFSADDANGIFQHQHLRFDGEAWHHTVVSERTADFALMGGCSMQMSISSPDIVLDAQDNAYIICRGNLSHNRMGATLLPAPDYAYHPANTCALLDQDVGLAEPIIDKSRWVQEHILNLLLQPNYDKQHQVKQRAVMLVDYCMNTAPVSPQAAKTAESMPEGYGDAAEDRDIVILDVRNMGKLTYQNLTGVAVIMPSINICKALEAARILIKRAGRETKIFIVEDTLRRGFIKTLNETAQRLDVKYIVYLAEDGFPGVNWLKLAFNKLEKTGKGLVAFNCGKWNGLIAAFGMVRTAWVRTIYSTDLLWHEYIAHRADNELTVIARSLDQYVFQANALLLEIDTKKIFRKTEKEDSNFNEADGKLFKKRFQSGFAGIVPLSQLAIHNDEYLFKKE